MKVICKEVAVGKTEINYLFSDVDGRADVTLTVPYNDALEETAPPFKPLYIPGRSYELTIT